jgi:hypothetical protein
VRYKVIIKLHYCVFTHDCSIVCAAFLSNVLVFITGVDKYKMVERPCKGWLRKNRQLQASVWQSEEGPLQGVHLIEIADQVDQQAVFCPFVSLLIFS